MFDWLRNKLVKNRASKNEIACLTNMEKCFYSPQISRNVAKDYNVSLFVKRQNKNQKLKSIFISSKTKF